MYKIIKTSKNDKVRDDEGNILVSEGDELQWNTIGGDYYEGIVIEMDSNVAHIKCTDGITRSVEL